jgi:hypothetical protein
MREAAPKREKSISRLGITRAQKKKRKISIKNSHCGVWTPGGSPPNWNIIMGLKACKPRLNRPIEIANNRFLRPRFSAMIDFEKKIAWSMINNRLLSKNVGYQFNNQLPH